MKNLSDLYYQRLQAQGYEPNPAQLGVVAQMQQLLDAFSGTSQQRRGQHGPLRRFFRGRQPRIEGIYLWGGVGTGKTFLMDLLFKTLPVEQKQRLHFHHFMQQAHELLRRERNRPDPLEAVADHLAQRARVLCFDEFFVTDITDAMILHHLLRGLFGRGLTLIATSNIAPVDLYKNGLQRERFVPAIQLIGIHTEVMQLDTGCDYRSQHLEKARTYHCPCGSNSELALERSFAAFSGDDSGTNNSIRINDRDIPVVRCSQTAAWFDFEEICGGPRAPSDYIQLSQLYGIILISNIPVMKQRDDAARRFIHLVDELYDRNVKLVVSAEAPAEQLYRDGRLGFEFKRTASRLGEMQTHQYLSRPHLA